MPLKKLNTVLTEQQLAHLLRRTTFGLSPELLKRYASQKPDLVLKQLLLNSTPSQPRDIDTGMLIGRKAYDEVVDGTYQNYVKRWFIVNMFSSPGQLHEKMILFWQNHFVSSRAVVSDSRYLYQYLELIRKHAFGNFRQFVIDMTKEPMMLRYLNGNSNTKSKPNENYARELQELFTIGRGSYDEADVKAAAKVLTGWIDRGYRDKIRTTDIAAEFRADQHDITDKQFSAFYQNTVIKSKTIKNAKNETVADPNTGQYELEQLIDMILKQKAVSLFICRKLYRWFVGSEIDADIEANVIEPLAQVFRQKYDIKATITELLCSEHFYEEKNRGAIIKSPTEFMMGMFRYFGQIAPASPYEAHKLGEYWHWRLRDLQQDILEQPSVFGWRPYYDTGFYQLWLNTNTLPLRASHSDAFVKGWIKISQTRYSFDPVALVRQTDAPADPVKLIDNLTKNFFAIPLSTQQKDYIIDNVLLSNLPRFEWTLEWNNYIKAIGTTKETSKRNAIKSKLDALFVYLTRMAEYQLV